ncbi:MAG: hypothetical protein ACYCPP_03475 [Nitrososphaerales archaeon]
MSQASSATLLPGKKNENAEPVLILGYCQNCGSKISLSISLQRFCSPNCKEVFGQRIATLRKARRNIYQREFRRTKYRTEAKHVMKVMCPKCNTPGYLVRYTVMNKETERVVSTYETVRHQVTRGGRSLLSGQCYIRAINESR